MEGPWKWARKGIPSGAVSENVITKESMAMYYGGLKKRGNTKIVKRKEEPKDHQVSRIENPTQYYSEYPAWTFLDCDQEMWTFSFNHVGNSFWNEILPRLRALESQTWGEILIQGKKQNHSLDPTDLNKIAQDRLLSKQIDVESLISLRMSGNHRLYGYMSGSRFNILWYDDNHEDNTTCVCRSRTKHT